MTAAEEATGGATGAEMGGVTGVDTGAATGGATVAVMGGLTGGDTGSEVTTVGPMLGNKYG